MSLELQDIHKAFGPVRANDGVSLSIEAGTLHGLLGENGAGKSTLMKILSGFISADAGRVVLDGTPLALSSPRDGIRAGIGMLHQDPLVFLPFSVLDNFLLGSGGGLRIDRDAGRRALRETGERFGFSFDPDAPARTLSIGERQQLEIARLLWLGARVLILDEPTTGISATQRTLLFEILRSLAAEGMIVVFVSHKLEEVEELCDRVTVMRKGRVVGEAEMPCPAERLVEMMFGRVFSESEPTPPPFGEPVLDVDRVILRERVVTTAELDIRVREGEIVGLAGLEGSGQRMLLRAAAGLLRPISGRIGVHGRDITGRPYRGFLEAGVHYLPAGRLEEGLVTGLTVAEHVLLARGSDRFFIDADEAREQARTAIADFAIVGTPESTAESLSGGNQQRLLLAMTPPDVRLLLMEHPTRGLDIESAEWVWTRLLERREAGAAIVFASADLDELLRYSDRIVVFFSGRILRVLDARTTSGEELGYLIGGKDPV
ncbi:MAG TPA: ATP-binding cassette domain-containing protein [Actinomycetota bacterium]|nr:ATP-binding cassette domain-containing protein [Actinomycetota bacterium]